MADKLVVVDDNVVRKLLANAKLLIDVPNLALAAKPPLQAAKKGCGGCGSRTPAGPNLMSVKRVIASLPSDQLNLVKAALGADKLRVIYDAGVTNMVI